MANTSQIDANQAIKNYVVENKEALRAFAISQDPSLEIDYTTVPSVDVQDNPSPQIVPVDTPNFNYDGTAEQQPLTDQQVEQNREKAKAGEKVKEQTPTSGAGSTPVNSDTTALKQKNILHENGASGDQDLITTNQSFKNAVGTASSLLSSALVLKTRLPNNDPRNITTNYYLTAREKALLEQKALQFSSIGIVPYDVIEDFLYILVYIESYEDLKYVAAVVGIPELDDRSLIRNPSAILNLKDLYKVGYLANGVAAITKQFSTTFPSARACSDTANNPYGSLLAVTSFGNSPLGALTAVYGATKAAETLGLTGDAAIAAASSLTSLGTITQFPGVNIVSDLIEDIATQAASIAGITALFSSQPLSTSISALGSVASGLTSLSSQVLNTSTIIANIGINSLSTVAGSLFSLSRQIRDVASFTNQVSGVTTLANTSAKVGDVNVQTSKINTLVVGIVSSISSITSLVSAITGPGDIVALASGTLNKSGGFCTSGIMSQFTLGQRLPPSVICKNPMMQPPSYTGRAFFGEGMTPRMSVDQMFCRRIATYPSNPSGSGVMSFQMQNFGSYGGSLSLAQLVTQVTLGFSTVPTTGSLASIINTQVSNIASNLGVSTSTLVEPRRSDNSIPFMLGTAAALVNDTKSPFGTDVFSSGWKLASSVGNDVQRYQPAFLETCRSSL